MGIKLFEICLSRSVNGFQLVDQAVLERRDGLVDAVDTISSPRADRHLRQALGLYRSVRCVQQSG